MNRAYGSAPRELTRDEPLTDEALTFVHDVLQHEDDGVRTRYQRLGLSGDKGNRLKNQLIENGVLDEQEVKTGRTYRLLLRVTPRARERLGLKKSLGRGSLAHEYWKRFYAATLREQGYDVELEAPRRKGRVVNGHHKGWARSETIHLLWEECRRHARRLQTRTSQCPMPK